MSEVRASVVIPVRNGAPHLRALLPALRAQVLPGGLEIVAIDSGSRDGSVDLLVEHEARVVAIPGETFDHGETRNLGAREACGRVVVLLTQDALPADEHVVRRLVEAVEGDRRLAGAFARQAPRADADPLTRRDLEGWVASREAPRTVFAADDGAFDRLPALERYALAAFDNVASAMRRDLLLAHPFAPSRFGEDVEWGLAMLRRGFGLAYVPAARGRALAPALGPRALPQELPGPPAAPSAVRRAHGARPSPPRARPGRHDGGRPRARSPARARGCACYLAAPAQSVAAVYGQYRGARDEARAPAVSALERLDAVRVLLVHHGYPPAATGGSEIYTEALARRLARDHEVAVLHRSADPERPDHDVGRSSRDGVRLYSLNNLHRDVPGFEAYRDPLAAAAAARVLDDFRPEVVHVGHLAGLSTGIVFEARRRGLAVVITLHDFWPVCPLGQLLNLELQVCPGPGPRRCLGCVGAQVATARPAAVAAGRSLPLAAAAGRLLSRWGRSGEGRIDDRIREMREVLRAADVLVSPSALPARSHGRARRRRHPGPAERPRAAAARPARASRLAAAGRPVRLRGIRHPVEGRARAGPRLPPARRPARIARRPRPVSRRITATPDTSRACARSSVRRADGIVQGAFAPAELPRVLGALDVLVVPSIWEENAPLTVQEAFLAGLPVVASDHGGLRGDGARRRGRPPLPAGRRARAVRR